jgi:hypothetical protein
MSRRNAWFAGLVAGLYALFLGVWLMAPARLTARLIAGALTTSMVVALLLIAAIVALATAYLRGSRPE